MAGIFSGWFGGSKDEVPPPPGPSAVIVDPGSKQSAGEVIEGELAKMSCNPSDQLKRVIQLLKDPKYVMSGGRRSRRHRKGSRAAHHRKGSRSAHRKAHRKSMRKTRRA